MWYVFFFTISRWTEKVKKTVKRSELWPNQSAFWVIWGWLVMLLWRWGGLGESDEFPTYKWSTTRSLFFCCPFPYKTPSNPGHGFGVCKWRNWMRDRLRSWIVGPWVVVFGMFTCRIRAWDYEVVPCILSAHGHNGENAKGRNEVIIIWQELSWDQRSKCYKWVVAEGNSLKVDRFKWLDMYLTYLWSFYVIKYLIDWCESFEKAYNWRKHVSTQPEPKSLLISRCWRFSSILQHSICKQTWGLVWLVTLVLIAIDHFRFSPCIFRCNEVCTQLLQPGDGQ